MTAMSLAQIVYVVGERVERLPDAGVEGLSDSFHPGLAVVGLSDSDLHEGAVELLMDQFDAVSCAAHDAPSFGGLSIGVPCP